MLLQIGVEQNLQAGAQRRQLGPQRRHFVRGRPAQFGSQLTPQLRLDGQLVLAPGGDFTFQLKVVDQLHVPRPRLIGVRLSAVDHRYEGAGDGGP
ncbi:hypothetical protein MYIN104542_20780 [Mycobacterium intermedium]